MQTKLTVGALVLVTGLIGGVLLFSSDGKKGGSDVKEPARTTSTTRQEGIATMENGIQYIDIFARGGYTPRVTKAKAGVPTVIRMKTENTYDCSMALVIPAIGYQSYLKQTGVEEIQISAEQAQGTLAGMCSMAMYHFSIEFE